MRKIIYAIFLALLIAPFGAMGQKIVFTPQWTPQCQFAGYYVAYEMGFYKEAGLDVSIIHPSASYPATTRLIDGTSSVVTMHLMQALAEMDRGTELVNILQTSKHSALVIAARDESIKSFDDLKGKKVGVWQVGFGELAIMADKELELGIQWIPYLQDINLFLSGAIDATVAMSYNEYLQIYAAGYDKHPVLSLSDIGYDIPEDGLYVTKEYYKRFPKQMDAFAQASRKGWEWAHEHPQETLDIVMKMMEQEKVYTSRIHQEWMLKEIIRLQKDTPDGKAQFKLDPAKIEEAMLLMLKHKLLSAPVNTAGLTGGDK